MRSFIARPEHGVVWISGASSGIGRALALKLAGEGYKVAATAGSHEKLAALQAEARGLPGSIIVLDGDVTDANDMEHVLASIEYAHGTLAMAILNAGIGRKVHADGSDRADLSGIVNCLVPAVRHMKAKGQGQIAIVASLAGYDGLPANAGYGATKAALIRMAQNLKSELDGTGIRIQLVNPRFVETAMPARRGFGMPGLVSAQEAAERISAGLKSQAFEIAFPKRLSYPLRLLRLVPYGAYFGLVRRAIAWRSRPSGGRHRPVTPHPAE
jgi:short-subunit dehydrogenase